MQLKFLTTLRTLAVGVLALQVWSGSVQAQKWTKLKNTAPFDASTALQLTDGRILVQAYGASQYYTLTPDINGSYVDGTWSQVASLPSNYGPLYYASAILPDDRVIVMGGEYNFLNAVWTNLGAIYDPVANTWTKVTAPSGWTEIGDAEGVVEANGTFLLASCCHTPPQQAQLNATTLTWTIVGSGKADSYDEEGYTLLPNNGILVVDANNTADPTNSELYLPAKEKWVTAGSTGVPLADPSSHELGPGPLLPNGTVFYIGATGNTATYTPSATGVGSWAAGPVLPNIGGQLDIADGPAAVLPDGNVLMQASPGVFNPPSYFFEYNGSTFTQEPSTTTASSEPSYVGRMLVLPTGQILWTDGSTNVEIYTAAGTYQPAWQPVVTTFPATITPGSSYQISGTLFNGMTQGAYYGDDAQMATNYPLVKIINKATHHVFFARTYNTTSMAVASPAVVTTTFEVPSNVEAGASGIVVTANGIPSAPVAVTVN